MADEITKLRPIKFCSKRYGYVLLAGSLLAFQDFSFAYQGMSHRFKAFTEEFMVKNFDQYHKLTVDRDAPIPKAGYPDVGAGHFARALSYKDWYKFNVHQRIHGNSIEHLSWFLPLLFVQGMFLPRFAATMAGVMFVGREFYRFGYLDRDGPSSKIREIGAIPLNIAGILLISSVAGFVWRRQMGGFISRRKTVRRFTTNHYDIRMEKVEKELDLIKKGVVTKKPTMLPMHPKII